MDSRNLRQNRLNRPCPVAKAGSGWAKPCLWTAAGGVLMVTLLTAAAAAMGLVALQGAASTVKLRVGGHALTLSLSREAPTSASGSRGRIWGAAGSTRGLPCRASGYCSLGRSKVWRGDVATNRALQAMLKAVTYKKELIVVMSSLTGFHRELALNALQSAEALGYGHHVLLAPQSAGCDRIPPPFAATTSCVWDSRPIVHVNEVFNSFYRRWDLYARVVRMGYNVLSLDSDTMMVADFYSFVKSPPFSHYHALFTMDGEGVSCGIVYTQNAHPSGPTVWMAVEHAYRTSRQRENMTHMQALYKGWTEADTWEQLMWNQVLATVIHGRPFHHLWEKTPAEWRQEWQLQGFKLWENKTLDIEVTWPAEWRNVSGVGQGLLRVVDNLALPVVEDAWWQRHSQYFYPPSPGNVSAQFLELIHSSSDQPLYEPGKPWAPPADLPQEHFAFLPGWFAHGYIGRGNLGYWDIKPPAAVILHNVWMPGAVVWKSYPYKAAGLFHWEVAEAVRGHNLLGLADPKLLMLAPGVQLFAETEQAFLDAVQQLVRLAGMMGRQLVMPNPPCHSVWVGLARNLEYPHPWLPLWKYHYDVFQVIQLADATQPGGNATYCHWLRGLTAKCMAAVPPHADALAFLDRWKDRGQAAPNKNNTLWHAEWQAAGGAAGPPPRPPAAITTPQPQVAVPDAEAVVAAAAAFTTWPVLFLGAVPVLGRTDTLQGLDEVHKGCELFADQPPTLEPYDPAGVSDARQRWLNGTL